MVYFEGSFFPCFCILYYSLFVLSFRRLCTGIIFFAHVIRITQVKTCDFTDFLYILHSVHSVPLAVWQRGSNVFYHPGAR